MGELTSIAPVKDAGRLIVTDHPVLIDGRRNIEADLRPGESLYSFLSRHVDLSEQWEVRIGGEVVPVEMWMRVRPKDGQVIEVVHAVNRQALYLVAMIALTYFTFGFGSATAGMWGAGAAAGTFSGVAGALFASAVYVGGSMLINKVLGPKPPEPAAAQNRDSVYSITSARNQARPYDPAALLLGHNFITPDLASMPYVWHEGDDQYLGMVLNVGINVHDVGDIYHGEGLLSQFDGVQVYYNNIPGKPNQTIPLYSNADTIEGGALEKTTAWVQRTTPTETRRIQINIEGQIGDVTSKGKDYYNAETIQAEYRPVGGSTWQPLTSRVISNANGKNYQVQRVTMSRDVAEGQYEVRVRRLYTAQDKDKGDHFRNATSEFQWTTMVAVQADDATYAGMGRIGIRVRATGQLSGALDQLRMEAWSRPVPVWNGTAWVTETTSNPGALILQFLRGIHDENGKIIAGLGLDDDEIDIPSLQAFMVHCAAEGYEYNHYLRDVRNNGDQLDAMARAGFGAMSWESGRWGVVWAADGQPVSGVVNMATIKRGQFQVDYTLAQAADGIEYTYLDSSDWQVKTIRVPAPGVDVMLNPATVQAEGVSTEAHAAQMARWHLAQSLYQYKDIVFSTDLEHLAYKRMDVLQLQHDLTQWGYGGRLVSVDGNVLTLDEPVPGNAVAWIGVRVPGEAVYRTLRVQAFEGESDTITLLDPWPSDAPLPDADNPAHDYIWIYDFKATPGYRVRVVGKELESDAKGASVAVVPEGPEFWNYVKTGEYIPPQPGSLLDTRPKASNVVVSEVQVVTGDVVHTELAVTFDLKGPAARTVIFAGVQGSEIGPVAETVTQTARFRIGSAGTYTIVVRPYNADGIAGESATVTYTTEGADIPPPPFDWATVEVGQSGLRRYAWGYYQFQPADLAGAEIRFVPGTVAEPDWDTMTPLGADGFFTAAFEIDTPVSGEWTFAFRARNTAGDLSPAVIEHVTLTDNVGEHIGVIQDDLIAQQAAIDQEVADRIAGDLQTAQDAADDATAKANAARDAALAAAAAAQAAVDALAADVAEIVGAPEWDPAETYEAGWLVKYDGALYRALVTTTGDQPDTSPAQWEKVGDYDSLGEAVAAALSMATQAADDIAAQVTRIDALYARMPTGTGNLATEAFVVAEAQALATEIQAEANRIDGIVARMPSGSGLLATQASVNDVASTAASATAAVANRTSTIEARMPAGSGQLATQASVNTVENASVSRDSALGERIDSVTANIGSVLTVTNPSFEYETGWAMSEANADNNVFQLGSGVDIFDSPSNANSGRRMLRFVADSNSVRYVHNFVRFPVTPNEVIHGRVRVRTVTAGGIPPDSGIVVRIGLLLSDGGSMTANGEFGRVTLTSSTIPWTEIGGEYTVPSWAKTARAYVHVNNLQTGGQIFVDDLEVEKVGPVASAAAAALTATQVQVTQQGDDLSALSGTVSSHTASINAINGRMPSGSGTLATASALSATQAQVDSQAGQISGLANTVDQVALDLAGTQGSVTQLAEVTGSAIAGNAVVNPSFESADGWSYQGSGAYRSSTSNARTGGYALRIDPGGDTAINDFKLPVHVGQRIRLGGFVRSAGTHPNSGSRLRPIMRLYNPDGSYRAVAGLGEPAIPRTFSWEPFTGNVYTVPAGVGYVSFQIGTLGHTSGAVFIDDVYLEPENNFDSRMAARHTVALNVNGHVSGTVSENDGETSSFGIQADRFAIVPSSSSGERLHWSDGNLRIYDSNNVLRVQLGVW